MWFSKMLPNKFNQFLNIGIAVCSFMESYMFPFTIIKWVIVATKYGGLILGQSTTVSVIPNRIRYMYSLQFTTLQKKIDINYGNVSHFSITLENKIVQLSFCGNDCKRIPPALAKLYGHKAQCLDLSFNNLETLKDLDQFGHQLQELILDNNNLGDSTTYPYLPRLRTLSLNNNQITDLEALLEVVREKYPKLTYLSLLRNKACPNQLSGLDKDDSDYQRYRYFVIYNLRELKFLDSRVVTAGERAEAIKRGEFMRVRRPPVLPPTTFAPTIELKALPLDLAALGTHRGTYGKCHYKYSGKHSEGNRFIVNSDL